MAEFKELPREKIKNIQATKVPGEGARRHQTITKQPNKPWTGFGGELKEEAHCYRKRSLNKT
jgi:hypothetical protein